MNKLNKINRRGAEGAEAKGKPEGQGGKDKKYPRITQSYKDN